MIENPSLRAGDIVSDFPSLGLVTTENIYLLEERLQGVPGFSCLVTLYDTTPDTVGPHARNVRRFAEAIVAEYEGSHQEQLLNSLFSNHGFDGAFDFMEQVVRQDFPGHVRLAALDHLKGIRANMRLYFGDNLPQKKHDEDKVVSSDAVRMFEIVLSEAEASPEFETNVIQLFSVADKITRETNPRVNALLKTLSAIDLVLGSDLVKKALTSPEEDSLDTLYYTKALECYEAGEQTLLQLVSFMQKFGENLSVDQVFSRMFNISPHEWPSYAQLPVKTRVQDLLTSAQANYGVIRGEATPALQEPSDGVSERETVTTIIHNSLEQSIRHIMRKNRVGTGSRKVNVISLPVQMRQLSAYLKGEEYRRKRTRVNSPVPVNTTVEVVEVVEPRKLVNAELQNNRVIVTDTPIQEKIDAYCKGLPNAAILTENIANILTSTSLADFNGRLSGLKQLSSTKGGRLKDADEKPINLFEIKPTELNAGVKINGQLLKQTRLVIALHSDGSLGLLLIGRRDKIAELLRNRGIT